MSTQSKQGPFSLWTTSLTYLSVLALLVFLAYGMFLLGFQLYEKRISPSRLSGEQIALAEEGMVLMEQSNCNTCHFQDQPGKGPSYAEISHKYDVENLPYLSERIKKGGSGVWGTLPKEPSPDLDDANIEKMLLAMLAEDPASLKYKDCRSGSRSFPVIGARAPLWIAAQLFLLFLAFVSGMSFVIMGAEFLGAKSGDQRFLRLAFEGGRLLFSGCMFALASGMLLLLAVFFLYPDFSNYLMYVLGWTILPLAVFILAEMACLFLYHYGWETLSPRAHLLTGLGLTLAGLGILGVINSWLSFMNSPEGGAAPGKTIGLLKAMVDPGWMYLNVNSFIANIAFAGAVAGACGAYRFLRTEEKEERCYYDWAACAGAFTSGGAFLLLFLTGGWQNAGITMFTQTVAGGDSQKTLSDAVFMLAILTGAVFLAANFYLWACLERTGGTERLRKHLKNMMAMMAVCLAVRVTPGVAAYTVQELHDTGAKVHPFLEAMGHMPFKNAAGIILVIGTLISILMYWNINKKPVVSWARIGLITQISVLGICAAVVTGLSVYQYYAAPEVCGCILAAQLSILVLAVAVTFTVNALMYKDAETNREVKWGEAPARAQYMIFILAATLAWALGMTAYARHVLRQGWHVAGIVGDLSAVGSLPALGYAGKVTAIASLAFFAVMAFILWLSYLSPENMKQSGRST
ncbi:cytochrome ubiquinol oxidase subunit I [Fibrobacterota bacterium]